MWRKRTGIWGVAVALLAVLPAMAAETPPDAEASPVEAFWKESEIYFTYIGRTTFYSCDSLERKVEQILKDVGARDDLQVRAIGCMDWYSPDRFVSVRIRIAIPTITTPGEGMSQEEKSRRELIAKVRGQNPADPEYSERFPASWERVRFSRRSRYLEDGDCELLEQMERHVFRKLDIHLVEGNALCIPGQVRFGQLNFEVEALKVLPKPDEVE